MDEKYVIVGHEGNEKWKGNEVSFRRITASERGLIRKCGKKQAKIKQDGSMEGDFDEDALATELIRLSIKEPVNLKNSIEIGGLDPVDYDNLLALSLKINPLAFQPTLLKE